MKLQFDLLLMQVPMHATGFLLCHEITIEAPARDWRLNFEINRILHKDTSEAPYRHSMTLARMYARRSGAIDRHGKTEWIK